MDAGKTPLRSAVHSLQQFLQENATDESTVDMVRREAELQHYEYPELAAQVFRFLQARRTTFQAPTAEEISEAFMTLLMDAEAVEKLGGGKIRQNPWLNVRRIIKATGQNLGQSLLEVYADVRDTGMGYTPTILDVAKQIAAFFAKLEVGEAMDPDAIMRKAKAMGLEAWKVVLLVAWIKRRRKAGLPIEDPPTDQDLEDLLYDERQRRELEADVEGPWEVYGAQAQALHCMRYFGQALIDLSYYV